MVSRLHEGEVPRPAQLGGAEGAGLRRGLLHRRDRAEGPLSRRPGDLGRLRRGARRGARPAVRGGPCRHRRGALRRAARAPTSARRRSCSGSTRRTGRRPSTRASGSSSRPTRPACYTDPAWGSNPDATYDCGKPFGPIWKVGWAGIKDKWPGAYKAIKAFTHRQRRDERDDHRGRSRRQERRGRRRRLDGQERGRWQEWIKSSARPKRPARPPITTRSRGGAVRRAAPARLPASAMTTMTAAAVKLACRSSGSSSATTRRGDVFGATAAAAADEAMLAAPG